MPEMLKAGLIYLIIMFVQDENTGISAMLCLKYNALALYKEREKNSFANLNNLLLNYKPDVKVQKH